MSHKNNDSVDDALVKLQGTLITSLFVMLFAYLSGKARNQQRKNQTLIEPNSLVVKSSQYLQWHKQSHKQEYAIWWFAGCVPMCMLQFDRSGLAFLILVGIICGAIFRIVLHRQDEQERQSAIEFACQAPNLNFESAHAYTICLPTGHKWQPERASRFMANILDKLGGKLVLQIVADHTSVKWRILDVQTNIDPNVVMQAIRSFFPDAEITVADVDMEDCTKSFHRHTMPFALVHPPLAPMRFVEHLTKFDPLTTLTSEMDALEEDESITYNIFVTDPAIFLYQQVENLLTDKQDLNPFLLLSHEGQAIVGEQLGSGQEQRTPRFHPDDQAAIEAKLFSSTCHQALVVMQIEAPSEKRVNELKVIATHLSQFDDPDYNGLRQYSDEPVQLINTSDKANKTSILRLFDRWLTNEDSSWQNHRLILNTSELASLWHLPHEEFTASRIQWLKPEIGTLPIDLQNNQEGLYLGKGVVNRVEHPVYMSPQDRDTHMLITGKIGMGKSTLLHQIIRQDINEENGVAVIDPKGNLIADILRNIPDHRCSDVIIWDIANLDNPPPLNFLLGKDGRAREDAASTIMSVFEKIYGDEFSHARMGQTLIHALRLIVGAETPTLRDISCLFTETSYRHGLLAHIDNPATQDFWQRYDNMTEKAQMALYEPVLRRLEMLYGDPVLYPILCNPVPLPIRQWMDQGKIILISLNSPTTYNLTKQNQALLGSLLVSEFQLAVASQDLEQPYYLYVDEAHRFVTSSIDEIFIWARQRKLSMTLATQFPKQLGQAYDAIMETVGATISFACEDTTAKVLSKRMQPEFSAHDLINLEVHDAAVRLRYQGKQMRPFLLKTVNVDLPHDEDVEHKVQELASRSQDSYLSQSVDDIRHWLKERYASGCRQSNDEVSKQDHLQFYEDDETNNDTD